MRLTTFDRLAFVEAVLNDVPKVDYDARAKLVVEAHLKARVPPAVLDAMESYREWFSPNHVNLPHELQDFCSYYTSRSVSYTQFTDPLVLIELRELASAAREQTATRRALKQKLTATIAACSTLKQARELLPEFENYLPTDRKPKATANVPAVVNLVTDLKAAGWPKGTDKEKSK